jgi:hypothetical protein
MSRLLPLKNHQEFSWPFWPVVPIYPYSQRRTLKREIVKDTIWTFEQIQGILYVVVPIRMTVIRLEEGGLLVYAPVAPTPECVRMIRELEEKYGKVKYIIFSTISGIEHKVFVGAFARKFPQSLIFVSPKQWSFPLNLPLNWLGFPKKRTYLLPEDSRKTPFADQFDYVILGPLDLGVGWFGEVALFHKKTETLLVTDTVISIPETPPKVVQLDPYPLLFHSRDTGLESIEDTIINRSKGWQRICLFALYFQPNCLQVAKILPSIKDAFQCAEKNAKAYWGWYPFQWQNNWKETFDILRSNGRVLVAPILQNLILNREPALTLRWVNQLVSWDFKMIIPCHFDAPIITDLHHFRQAFSFLEKQILPEEKALLLPESDLNVFKKINDLFDFTGLVPPAKEKI